MFLSAKCICVDVHQPSLTQFLASRSSLARNLDTPAWELSLTLGDLGVKK